MQIGPHALRNNLFVAPMAGVSDRPFRKLCRRFGAGLAVSEMVSARPELRQSAKTQRRLDHEGEPAPLAVQIAGADPQMMADAARYGAARGAQIIDINMGCPAKKVCSAAAGSALLRDEALVGRILEAVVRATDVPVTLKFRTGWDAGNRNALRVARIAEDAGIRMLTLHGRTRACGFAGRAEYDTIREVKRASRLPVVANGDIRSPEQARRVLEYTGADGVMIGRAAHGRPWIFREIAHYLATGRRHPGPLVREAHDAVLQHLHELYSLHGSDAGVKVARKHVHWYTSGLAGAAGFRQELNGLETCEAQLAAVDRFFERLAQSGDRLRQEEELPE
ncbi:MAG: tRNA dihydrouridine synthase DusB [Burkholderiales bacterium]|nr:tRNA dihydrouridine synthase DusB [Burkholderiales bacterium]